VHDEVEELLAELGEHRHLLWFVVIGGNRTFEHATSLLRDCDETATTEVLARPVRGRYWPFWPGSPRTRTVGDHTGGSKSPSNGGSGSGSPAVSESGITPAQIGQP
jgi:hypothetical protein